MRLLELFSGTGSVGKIATELGWEVVSLDIDAKRKATYTSDITSWNYKDLFKEGDFDIVWASPPCQMFSQARKCWINRTNLKAHPGVPFTTELFLEDQINYGLPPLRTTQDIIKYLNPKYYFIENPGTGDMKNYLDYPFIQVDYCRFGFDYKKRTNIWNNLSNLSNQLCEGVGKCPSMEGRRHKVVVSGNSTNTQRHVNLNERYSIPPLLIKYLFSAIK